MLPLCDWPASARCSPVFAGGEEEVEDLHDDGGAHHADDHHPHDQEEERQRLGAEPPHALPGLLHPHTHRLGGEGPVSFMLASG